MVEAVTVLWPTVELQVHVHVALPATTVSSTHGATEEHTLRVGAELVRHDRRRVTGEAWGWSLRRW